MGEPGRLIRRVAALAQHHVTNLWVNTIISSSLVPDHLRWVLLRASGYSVERSLIGARGFIGSRKIVIGRGCSLNRGVFLDGLGPVILGNQVSIGMNALILTGSHEMGDPDKRAGALTSEAVRVEDGAWIGANAVVMPGITIGRGSVVGAGSVVMKDVAPNAVVMGNPARIVRRLDEPAVPVPTTSADA